MSEQAETLDHPPVITVVGATATGKSDLALDLAERLGGDRVGASLLRSLNPATILDERNLIVKRDAYRQKWFDACNACGADFVLTVPHPLPAFERGGTESATLTSASYCILFNIVRSFFLLASPLSLSRSMYSRTTFSA